MSRRSVNFTSSPYASSGFNRETGKLPEIRFVHRRRSPLRKQSGPAVERRPVRLHGWARTEVRAGDVENLAMRQIVGDEDAFSRVVDHVDEAAENSRRHLKDRGVLAWNELPRLVNIQLRSRPPRRQAMAHQENAELVDAA